MCSLDLGSLVDVYEEFSLVTLCSYIVFLCVGHCSPKERGKLVEVWPAREAKVLSVSTFLG